MRMWKLPALLILGAVTCLPACSGSGSATGGVRGPGCEAFVHVEWGEPQPTLPPGSTPQPPRTFRGTPLERFRAPDGSEWFRTPGDEEYYPIKDLRPIGPGGETLPDLPPGCTAPAGTTPTFTVTYNFDTTTDYAWITLPATYPHPYADATKYNVVTSIMGGGFRIEGSVNEVARFAMGSNIQFINGSGLSRVEFVAESQMAVITDALGTNHLRFIWKP